ncbi:MAG: hypothetical protein M9916_00880 [Crocinitomicaceae bacterium]|nr:hypothetical protein [Crocinitomicaceae bacterium]
MSNIQVVARELAAKTAKQGLLSFGNGITNIIGARHTNKNIRLRVTNGTDNLQTVYLIPSEVLGTPASNAGAPDVTKFGLPAGVPFFLGTFTDGGKDLTIVPLNLGQNVGIIGNALKQEPTQVVAISMKSFTTGGLPENTNYGNSLTHYKLSHLEEPKRSTPLNLDAFQTSRDVSTEILKIDLIKNKFAAVISQNDALAFQINAGTKMDITLHLGARMSMPEYFYRQVEAGSEVVANNFPGESAVDCGCR